MAGRGVSIKGFPEGDCQIGISNGNVSLVRGSMYLVKFGLFVIFRLPQLWYDHVVKFYCESADHSLLNPEMPNLFIQSK